VETSVEHIELHFEIMRSTFYLGHGVFAYLDHLLVTGPMEANQIPFDCYLQYLSLVDKNLIGPQYPDILTLPTANMLEQGAEPFAIVALDLEYEKIHLISQNRI
jgi:hypothetical protein